MAKKTRLPTQFSAPEQSPGFLLWQVSNAWQRELRKALKPTGITHPQFVLLASAVWLEDQGEVATQSKLSKQTAMDKMTVSDVIRTLEQKRLVKRGEHKKDSRAVCVVATKKGLEVIKKALPLIEQADASFFARSSKKQQEIVEVLQALSLFSKPVRAAMM